MSDLGTKLVCLGEATIQDKIVQTWAEAKKKVTSLLELCSISATPEQGSAMEEGRALIGKDEVTEAEKRYEYWSNRQYYNDLDCSNFILPGIFYVIFLIFLVSIFPSLVMCMAVIFLCPSILVISEVVRVINMYMVKKDIKAAKERAKVSAEMMAVMKEAAEVINSTWAATQLWYQAKQETLKKLLLANDTPQIREEFVPAFFGIADAIKAWKNAKLVCQQAINELTDRSRIAEEATRISEAVIAAEAVSRKVEEILCQAISHTTIPAHNDSTENKSDLVIEKQ
jgi:hypothetical protein